MYNIVSHQYVLNFVANLSIRMVQRDLSAESEAELFGRQRLPVAIRAPVLDATIKIYLIADLARKGHECACHDDVCVVRGC